MRLAYSAQLPSGSRVGNRADLLEFRTVVGPDLDVMVQATMAGAHAALLTARDRGEVAEQHIAARHELYSGYSSAAVLASPPRSAPTHSAISLRYAANSASSAASRR